MRPRSIRIPDELDRRITELALERQTSYTEIVIWASKKYFDMEDEFVARQDRRTVSGRVPVAEQSRVPVEKEQPGPKVAPREPAAATVKKPDSRRSSPARNPALSRQAALNKAKGL